MRFWIFILTLFFCNKLCAQQETVVVKLEVDFADNPLILHKDYLLNGDTINIETVKFYVSNLSLNYGKKTIKSVSKKYHLVNLEDEQTLQFDTKISTKINFNKVNFTLGIDSSTNIMGALGGDLDPTKDMYWTWQSGYINCKIEGTASNCPARKHHFQFHLGGYQHPFANWQHISLEVTKRKTIIIKIPIDKLLESIQLESNYEIMSPSAKAVDYTKYLSSLFSVQ